MFKKRRVVTNFCLECSPFGLASSLALSITAALSHKPSTPRLSARVTAAGGRSNTHKHVHVHACTHTHTHTHTNTFFPLLTPSHMHTISLPLFLSVFLSVVRSHTHTHTHTHSLTSPGIRSFYRAAMCWRGRWYGRAVSPSSDWISDQYPVPRRPASLGWTDCLWKPVLVVSRLPSLMKNQRGLMRCLLFTVV